jgi:hypothetical protein
VQASFISREDRFYQAGIRTLRSPCSNILFVKVRHTLRDLVYHLHRVDSCGISLAQALQVLDEVSLWIILADLFERGQRQTNRKRESGKRDCLSPGTTVARRSRWTRRKARAHSDGKGLPYPDFSQESLAWCCFVEHLDRDRVFAPRPAEHLAERPKADLSSSSTSNCVIVQLGRPRSVPFDSRRRASIPVTMNSRSSASVLLWLAPVLPGSRDGPLSFPVLLRRQCRSTLLGVHLSSSRGALGRARAS